MTSGDRPANATWEVSFNEHSWCEGRVLERSFIRGWLDDIAFGQPLHVRGRSRSLGERTLLIHALERGGYLVEYQRATMAFYFLVGGSAHRPVTVSHENGQVDDFPPRFAVEADMALEALATFVSCGDRHQSFEWEDVTNGVDRS